jgi:hypothetical protein
MDISAHECSKFVSRELEYIFPGVSMENMIAVITMQHTQNELVKWGDEVDAEKDYCLEEFMEFAKDLCTKISALGYWADYIDPCSGLAMMTPDANKPYNEVSGAEYMLGYKCQNAGCCKILLHPRWGSAVYPASLFTSAPREVLLPLLPEIPRPTERDPSAGDSIDNIRADEDAAMKVEREGVPDDSAAVAAGEATVGDDEE